MLIKKSFYFIRHGESEHNKREIFAGGTCDSSLTDKGVDQALLLKEKLTSIQIDHVISSPLIRAKKTAEIATGRSPILEEGLREINLGDFQGKSYGVIDLEEYMIALPHEQAIPGGESKQIFSEKVRQAVNRWLGDLEGNILFVSHGFVYSTLLSILGKTLEISDLRLDNATIVHFYHNEVDWEVRHLS